MGMMRGMGAAVKALRQGEVLQYTELLEDRRRHAIDRMVDNAQRVRRRYRGWAQRLTELSP